MVQGTIKLRNGATVVLPLEIGPDGNSYVYGYECLGWTFSKHRYHNAASARHDAERVQRVNDRGNLEPIDV